MATNQTHDETVKKGLKALAKMSRAEFEGLKQIIKILSQRRWE